MQMHRNKTVMTHNFAMVPKADIPRSSFHIRNGHKTTFDAGYLIPVYVTDVLPGDSINLHMTAFARLTTPIFPIMDNLFLDSFFFFVPNRLVWTHWINFMGEQANPGDSISYTVPQITSPAGGWVSNSIFDYFGLPTAGQVTGSNTTSNVALFSRAYNLIWNQWFRDENLQNSVTVDMGDGPDTPANYTLLRRGKRADYFTSCLPWPQKGNTAVSLPLGTSAPVSLSPVGSSGVLIRDLGTHNLSATSTLATASGGTGVLQIATGNVNVVIDPGTSLFADLSNATAATINSIRLAFQTQRLLERDARGGTRYTEIVRSHFGVISPDSRLQRPEYLGGGSQPVNLNPIAQTSGTAASGTTTPLGTLSAMGTILAKSGVTASFVEHGMIIGLVSVRADLTYQQGQDRMFSKSTRYDYYFPAFCMLGEQAVLNKEIYMDGSANDTAVFGYQEHWAELRFKRSQITGQFRSTFATPLDAWHLAQKFTSLPTLNTTFIQETPPVSRVLAVGAAANGQQFYFDSVFDCNWARPLPAYSVPGMVDHF